MTVSDEEFKRSLRESHGVTVQIAEWLRSKGRDVHVQTTKVRPTIGQCREYADSGDILLKGKGRIEVKYRRDLSFVCTETYPYPTVFVDEAHKADREHAEPLVAYIVVNKERTHVAIIKQETRPFWVKSQRHDSRTNDQREFYECPKILCQFRSMKRT